MYGMTDSGRDETVDGRMYIMTSGYVRVITPWIYLP